MHFKAGKFRRFQRDSKGLQIYTFHGPGSLISYYGNSRAQQIAQRATMWFQSSVGSLEGVFSEVTLVIFLKFFFFRLFCEGKSVTDYQRKLTYNSVAGGVKGPKEEMREKITLIKRILDEVSALAEICGGMLIKKLFYRK